MASQSFSDGWNNTNISLALDPSGRYQHCSLEYSRLAIVNQKLYLDGGETKMMIGDDSKNQFWETSSRLLWMDLTEPFNYSHYTVHSRSLPWDIPSMGSGVAYVPSDPENTKFYAFAGNYPSMNVSAISYTPPPSNPDEVGLLRSYNTESELWTTEDNAGVLTGLAGGAATTNLFTNEGYYLGGGQDIWVLQGAPDLYVEGMVILNMSDVTWTNQTVPGPSTSGAFMEYLPVGEKGVLVVFGGRGYDAGVLGSNSVAIDMDQIQIYDVASGTWHTQKASGTPDSPDKIPDPRIIGCSVMAAAPDNSSYNVYMFGGEVQLGGPRTSDFWVLSLPSFTWIKLANDKIGTIGSTCRRIGNQMLHFGNGNPSVTECQEFFRIFDMTSLEWTNAYIPGGAEYQVPPAISSVVGGNETGGATMLEPLKPASAWSGALEDVFSITPWGPANYSSKFLNSSSGDSTSTASPGSTPASNGTNGGSSTLSAGKIAGISVGASVGVVILALSIWLIFFYRKKITSATTKSSSPPPSDAANSEFYAFGPAPGMSARDTGPNQGGSTSAATAG